jgi:hypothetical protein
MGPYQAVGASESREVFEAYVEKMLTPALRAGQMTVMDNLSSHRGERGRKRIEERSCQLLACHHTRRSQFQRGGLRQDEGAVRLGRSSTQQASDRGDGYRPFGGYGSGRVRLLRTSR